MLNEICPKQIYLTAIFNLATDLPHNTTALLKEINARIIYSAKITQLLEWNYLSSCKVKEIYRQLTWTDWDQHVVSIFHYLLDLKNKTRFLGDCEPVWCVHHEHSCALEKSSYDPRAPKLGSADREFL